MKAVIAGFAALSALAAAPQAMACSCIAYQSAEEQAEAADVIFIGHVVDTGPARDKRGFWQRLSDWSNGHKPLRQTITTFQIDDPIKGDLDGDFPIRHLSGIHSATCGVSFPKGQEVTVLAYTTTDGHYTTSMCSWPQFSAEDYKNAVSPD